MAGQTHGQMIRELDTEYQELTGENLFSGVSHPTPHQEWYYFSDGNGFGKGSEALAHMKAKLEEAKAARA